MDKRLHLFGYLERMEESAWPSKCRTFRVSSCFPQRKAQESMEQGNQVI